MTTETSSAFESHMERVRAAYERVQERIQASLDACGGTQAPRVLAVSKGYSSEMIECALRLGIRAIGENYLQEAKQKWPYVALAPHTFERHFIGRVQSNKAALLLSFFDCVESLCSLDVARKLHQSLPVDTFPVFIQVNTSAEDSKQGLLPSELGPFLEHLEQFPKLQVRGLMTMAALGADEKTARTSFALLRSLAETHQLSELSMGMSADYQWAVQEGASLLRLGRALFGESDG